MKKTISKSKTSTRSGTHDGIFRTESSHPETTAELVNLLTKEAFTPHQEYVTRRLIELEEKALNALQRCGFRDWSEQVLMVNGERVPGEISDEIFSTDTSNERLTEILTDLGVINESYEIGSAASVQPAMSVGAFANIVYRRCGAVEGHISNGNLWGAMANLSAAERSFCDMRMAEMEADYIRGKRQRTESTDTDWDVVLAEWAIERLNHGKRKDRHCDRIIAERHGLKPESIKHQRRLRKPIG